MPKSNFTVVRYKNNGKCVEVLAKPETVERFRQGKLGIDNVLVSDSLYLNANKGDLAKIQDIQTIFGTDDIQACLETVLRRGEYSLTARERSAKIEQKRGEILNYISKYYINPKTDLPHPMDRIEAAVSEIRGLKIDLDSSVELQARAWIKKLGAKLICKECSNIVMSAQIPCYFLSKAMGIIRKYGRVVREDYNEDGDAVLGVEMIPGNYAAMATEIKAASKGSIEI